MTTTTAHDTFDALLEDFYAEQYIAAQDRAIMEHALDGWPMGNLAKQYGTTAGALHRREKQLLAQMREFLERRGIYASTDLFEPGSNREPHHRNGNRN